MGLNISSVKVTNTSDEWYTSIWVEAEDGFVKISREIATGKIFTEGLMSSAKSGEIYFGDSMDTAKKQLNNLRDMVDESIRQMDNI